MPNFGPIYPDGDGATVTPTLTLSTGSTVWNLIDDDPDTGQPDGDYVEGDQNSASTIQYLSLAAFPGDLDTVDSAELRVYVDVLGTRSNDDLYLDVGITTADDGTTYLAGDSSSTPNRLITWDAGTTPSDGVFSVDFSYVNTGAAASAWNGSWIRLEWVKAKSAGWDTSQYRIHGIEINGVYTAAAASTTLTYVIS